MDSLRKGLSGRDAAQAAMGQGRPFTAGPWSNGGGRAVERSETRMPGVLSLWLLSLCTSKEKVTRPRGRNPKPQTTPRIRLTLPKLSLLALLLSPTCWAFDLEQLSQQLASAAVVHGPFIQEKHLRALPQPLTSQGNFVLSRELGLLWQLHSPLQQDYRIDGQGIARRTVQGWQQQPGQGVAAQQSRLFLAVLSGDHQGLQENFQLSLSGNAEDWQLSLNPRSLLLQQVFRRINISGGALVERIELEETQGDSTLLRLTHSETAASLSAEERRHFAE